MITASDLAPGQTYHVVDGMCITPQPCKVEIVWVSDLDVHYRKREINLVRQTPIERFLEIVNASDKQKVWA